MTPQLSFLAVLLLFLLSALPSSLHLSYVALTESEYVNGTNLWAFNFVLRQHGAFLPEILQKLC